MQGRRLAGIFRKGHQRIRHHNRVAGAVAQRHQAERDQQGGQGRHTQGGHQVQRHHAQAIGDQQPRQQGFTRQALQGAAATVAANEKRQGRQHVAEANVIRAVTHATEDERRGGQPSEEAGRTGGEDHHIAGKHPRGEQLPIAQAHRAALVLRTLGHVAQEQGRQQQQQRHHQQHAEDRLPAKVIQHHGAQQRCQGRR